METVPVIFTLFGATGDLAKRKLYPALFRLYQNGHIGDDFALIGTGRTKWEHDEFRENVKKSILASGSKDKAIDEFIEHFYFISLDIYSADQYQSLNELITKLNDKYNAKGNRIFYLSIAPSLFPVVSEQIRIQELMSDSGFNRLIIEKPFGRDYDSCQELNDKLLACFSEDQIYRIDHYLGKETVQSIYNLRFRNLLFSNSWNNKYIEKVNIYLNEKVGIEERGSYYDDSGAIRDMIQNHALQLLALITMDKPDDNDDDSFSREKTKILNALHFYSDYEEASSNLVVGQYGPNSSGAKGYREEAGVESDSVTETFFAGRFYIDTPTWEGVPFIVQTGKNLEEKYTAIEISFKTTDSKYPGNKLVIHIDPRRGYCLRLNHKVPGYTQKTDLVHLEFEYEDKNQLYIPEDYERLISEALAGNKNYFVHQREISAAWKFIDHIKAYIEQMPKTDFPNYEAGSNGPKEVEKLQ